MVDFKKDGRTNEHLITHGETGTRLYRIWKAMRTRCNNPNIPQAHLYSGKGITVCDEWDNNYESFKNWSLENGYQDNLSIDRINNDGNYEPNNCRWATRLEQSNNTSQNVNLTHNGETLTLSEWSRILNIDVRTISARHTRGYSVEQILGFEPLMFKGKPTRSVIQMDMNGNFIDEFPSIKSAKIILGIHHITDCCRGKRNSSGGYKWKYKDGEFNE